jgi:predicted SprT family Zn-dependent metalloprotease
MVQHGVGGLAFEFMTTKRMMGECQFRRIQSSTGVVKVPTKIRLSRSFVEAGISMDEITDTMLHEIAHAIAGHAAGHGPEWKAVCRRIGADPTRTSSATASPEATWKGYCPRCENVRAKFHRAPLRVRFCAPCHKQGQKVYLKWFKDGTLVPLHKMPARYREEMNYRRNVTEQPKPKTLEDFFKF